MNVTEASRTRHLVIRLDRGEELPAALLRALGEAEVRAAWITGMGTLDAAELASVSADGRELRRHLDTPSTAVTLEGNAAIEDGALTVHLSTVLARETDLGASLAGGKLLAARARSLELHVTVFDDLELVRHLDERGTSILSGRKHSSVLIAPAAEARPAPAETRAPVAEARPAPAETRAPVAEARPAPTEARVAEARPAPTEARVAEARPAPAEARVPVAEARPAPTEARSPQNLPAARQSDPQLAYLPANAGQVEQAVLPPKPMKQKEDLDTVYPEVGDAVNHFAFGECMVILSDGDRIRLRQDRDGRVREVALAMLKVEPLADGPNGMRMFMLARKN